MTGSTIEAVKLSKLSLDFGMDLLKFSNPLLTALIMTISVDGAEMGRRVMFLLFARMR